MTEFLNFPNSGLFLLFSIIATVADIAMFYLAIRFAIQRLPEILEKTRNPLYTDRYSDKEEIYAYRNEAQYATDNSSPIRKMIISQPEMKKIIICVVISFIASSASSMIYVLNVRQNF